MRRIAAAILLAAVLMIPAALAYAENEDADLSRQIADELTAYDFSQWEAYFEALPDDIASIFGNSVTDMVSLYANGQANGDYDGTLDKIKQALIVSVKQNMIPLTSIMALALISGLIGILTDGEKDGLSEIISFICTGMCLFVLAYNFTRISDIASNAAKDLSLFTEAAVPVLSMLTAAVGGVGTSAMLSPLSVFLNTTVVGAFNNLILPLTLIGAAITTVSALVTTGSLGELAKLIKTALKWTIGVIFTVYLGMLTVQGIAAAGADSVALKSAKYALDKSIPIVGGAVSGTLGTVISCTGMIKNAAGITAAIIAVSYVISPLICIGGATLALRVGAAVSEPVANSKIPKLLSGLGDICNYLFAAVAAIGIMFMITMGLCTMVGGV